MVLSLLLAFWNTKPSSGACAVYLSLVNMFLGKAGQQQLTWGRKCSLSRRAASAHRSHRLWLAGQESTSGCCVSNGEVRASLTSPLQGGNGLCSSPSLSQLRAQWPQPQSPRWLWRGSVSPRWQQAVTSSQLQKGRSLLFASALREGANTSVPRLTAWASLLKAAKPITAAEPK